MESCVGGMGVAASMYEEIYPKLLLIRRGRRCAGSLSKWLLLTAKWYITVLFCFGSYISILRVNLQR
jgi:hypothetical protein